MIDFRIFRNQAIPTTTNQIENLSQASPHSVRLLSAQLVHSFLEIKPNQIHATKAVFDLDLMKWNELMALNQTLYANEYISSLETTSAEFINQVLV